MPKPEEIRKIDGEPRIPGSLTPEAAEQAGEILSLPDTQSNEQAFGRVLPFKPKEKPAAEHLPIAPAEAPGNEIHAEKLPATQDERVKFLNRILTSGVTDPHAMVEQLGELQTTQAQDETEK